MVLAIAGGSGSGKTLVASSIGEALESRIALVGQDSYYKCHGHLSVDARSRVNYDHPDAFDIELLCEHLDALRTGKPVETPVYDYATHTRTIATVHVEPAPIVMVEGILTLAIKGLRDLCDVKIFVDTDADVRFIRRLSRDVAERGRSLDSVVDQYLNVVRPMHLEFVEPSKRFADMIVPEGGYNRVAIDFIVARLKELLDGPERNYEQFPTVVR